MWNFNTVELIRIVSLLVFVDIHMQRLLQWTFIFCFFLFLYFCCCFNGCHLYKGITCVEIIAMNIHFIFILFLFLQFLFWCLWLMQGVLVTCVEITLMNISFFNVCGLYKGYTLCWDNVHFFRNSSFINYVILNNTRKYFAAYL